MAGQKELDASRTDLEFCRIWASLKEQRYKTILEPYRSPTKKK